ncbi:unnamed protein product [Adineta steineri]|uniref:Uncharacterized protein n=1 Tax=Adineta steineri TaxID=433720 RepID=A0A815LCY1_9BILA|nr:unnamed protein product [Adineta steineri]CAF1616472.1 unnamed protein product [Adineta steineri]
MPSGHRTATISSIVPLTSDEHEVELHSIRRNSDNQSINSNTGSSHGKSNSNDKSRWKKFLKKFDFLNVEKRGIQRVLPEDRNDSTIINTAMIWVSSNMIIPCFAIGTLGPAVFKLGLYESFVAIIIFNIIGIIPTAAIACFGPASGLRTMVFSRYSWGFYGASVIAALNVISALGWAAVNSITGAQTLRVVFNDKLPIAVGIIIIAILSMIVSFVGYRWIHIYERYSWIPVFIAYCIVAGVSGKYISHSQTRTLNATISNEIHHWDISSILSFGSVCFGNAVSWCSFAADYTTYFPENTSQMKVFVFTYLGNFLTLIPLGLLGAAVYTGTYTNPSWSDAYEKNSVGGLLGASISSVGGFGKFLLVLFSLSTVACNIPNIYSLSLSSQVVAPIFKHIPRIVYTVIGTVIYVILGIVAASSFNSALTSFTDVISYWFCIFIVIVFEEHLIFRRCSYKNYDFDIYDNRKVLPISIAAITSGLIGLAGIILGMSQTWFEGPISKAIAGNSGQHHPDVGFECAIIFTAVTFPLLRLLELHFIKR